MSYSKEKKIFLVKQYEQGKPVAVISKPMGSQRAVFIAGFENTMQTQGSIISKTVSK